MIFDSIYYPHLKTKSTAAVLLVLTFYCTFIIPLCIFRAVYKKPPRMFFCLKSLKRRKKFKTSFLHPFFVFYAFLTF